MCQREHMLGALSFEQTKIVSKFCRDVLLLDDQTVFVSVISRHGRQIDSAIRGASLFSDLPKHELEQVYLQRMLQTQMIKDFDDKLSKLSVAIIEREFYIEGIFPFYDGMLLVVFNSHTQILESIKKISKSISEFNFEIAKSGVTC
ncbi:MAG TPA: hypothetical protein VD828_00270 [Candidatus Nitrosotenuis sp.]|nr:hypothetical protein [Candidatus Nitrosotenuis sp.]